MEILWLPPVAALLLGYLLGSIPFGLLLAKAAGVGDLRKIGSGNIGATNVLRTGKKGTAAATLLFDIGKGVAAVLVGMFLMDGGGVLGGAAAFFGHCCPGRSDDRGVGTRCESRCVPGGSVRHSTIKNM